MNPYVVGAPRKCHDCGAEFQRATHRSSYCPACEKKKARVTYLRAREKKRGPDYVPRARSTGRAQGRRLAVAAGAGEHSMRETRVTYLPVCARCRRYPATRNRWGWLDCGNHWDE